VVWDGKRPVAIVRSSDILLMARTPEDGPDELRLPTERMHLDNLVGSMLPTWAFIKKVKTHGAIWEELGESALPQDRWEASERHLDFVRRQTLPSRTMDAIFRFTVDPVYGYRIDAIKEVAFREPVDAGKHGLGVGTFSPGCYVPWDDVAIYNRTVITPGSGGMLGWANNLLSVDRSDLGKGLTWRDGGFIAYLTTRSGWGIAYTRMDGAGTSGNMKVCNAHNDFHHQTRLPQLTLADADGWYRHRWHHRLLAVPPEVSSLIWDEMKLRDQERSSVILSIGSVDDMEAQPVSLAEAKRGLVWTSRPPQVVNDPETAFSGEKYLRFQAGRSWPNLPQVALRPGVRYELSARVRMIPWTDEERATAKAKDDRRREKLAKKGKDLPPEIDWDAISPRARISADEYEWTPHSGKWTTYQATPWTTTVDGTRERISLPIDGADWGQNVNIVFHIEGGHALVDDFALVEVNSPRD
jgi:hypothetical protein